MNNSEKLQVGWAALRLAGSAIGHVVRASRSSTRSTFDLKLIHTSELSTWSRFPRCQDWVGTSYREYLDRAHRIARMREPLEPYLAALRRLQEIRSDDLETYHVEHIVTPRSLIPRELSIPLGHEPLPGTEMKAESGRVLGRSLITAAGPIRRNTAVRYLAPSRIVHRDEIERLSMTLTGMSEFERDRLDEVRNSRYGQPVLFVSHRWESADHPDPNGEQLRRLQRLRDCFIIYDYCSFPQEPRTPSEEEQLQAILGGMNELIRNVVILSDPDYLTRGWCIYEYAAAALAGSTVCDEVQDPRLVSLRNWAATRPPTPVNLVRDSFESRQSNHINKMTLEAVNAILPALRHAEFTVEGDRTIVSALLRDSLKRKLPPRKEYQPPLSEWKYRNWTDEDLRLAFEDRLPLPSLNTQPIAHFDTNVPSNLDDAADQRYRVSAMRRNDWWL